MHLSQKTQKLSRCFAYLLSLLIRGYQLLISPLIGPRCRFYPTCSHYARLAIQEHGVCKGLWLASARLARCHPLHPGGYDPVPQRLPQKSRTTSR